MTVTIAYMGIPGSNSEQAAMDFAAEMGWEDYDLLPRVDSRGVIRSMDEEGADYGVVAVANINAASAQIIYGDFQRAQRYMDRVKDDPRAWNNLGVLSWLRGETEVAKVWFEKAMQSEPEKAKANLEKMAAYE